MNDIDLNDLERKAKAAGGEEWQQNCLMVVGPPFAGMYRGKEVCHCGGSGRVAEDCESLAAYIAAAHPAAVLALIERVRELERANARRPECGFNATIVAESRP